MDEQLKMFIAFFQSANIENKKFHKVNEKVKRSQRAS